MGFSQTAYGEILYGDNGKSAIFVTFEEDLSKIVYKSTHGTSEYDDSVIKQFKHGGFFLKNPEMLIFGHPQVNDKYTLVVITSMGFEKFTVSPLMDMSTAPEIDDIEPERDDILEEYWESRENTVTRPAEIETFELDANITQHAFVYEDADYQSVITVYNHNIQSDMTNDAKVTLEFSRATKTVFIETGITNEYGKVRLNIPVSRPDFYPTFCYDVKVTIQKDDQTIYRYDDFFSMSNSNYFKNEEGYPNIQSDIDCNDRDTMSQITTRDQPFR